MSNDKGFSHVWSGLAGFALGQATAARSRVIKETEVYAVEVPVEVPVHIHPSVSDMAAKLDPSVAMFFNSAYHLTGYAEAIAAKDGIEDINISVEIYHTYMNKAAMQFAREFSTFLKDMKVPKKKVNDCVYYTRLALKYVDDIIKSWS